MHIKKIIYIYMPWLRGLVISSSLATEEIGAMGREIQSRLGKGW
jgi:hypothetical protein